MRRLALALVVVGLVAGCSRPEGGRALRVACWADYLAPSVLQHFARQNSREVTVETFDSNDELLQRLAEGVKYDVVFLSDDFVQLFAERGLLRKLDAAKVPNRKNIAPRLMGLPMDPKNEYTVPFFWGTTGIAYNRDKVTPAPTSWKDLWDERHKGHVALADDPREAVAAALLADGRKADDFSADALGKAKERLLAHRALSSKRDSSPRDQLLSGDLWICQCYSGDALQARQAPRPPPIEYIVPAEGGTLWLDSMAIPAGAADAEAAHRFIDFVLRPETGAVLAEYNGYASANLEAARKIPAALQKDPVVNPTEETLKRCTSMRPLTAEERGRLDALWAEVARK